MRCRPLLLVLCSLPATARTVSISAPPFSIAPNEGRNPAGQIEGIEGGGFTARASDVGAIFCSPAGLAQRTFRADGTSYDLLLTGGLQWDLSEAVTLGLVVAGPGSSLGGTTGLIAEEAPETARGSRTAWFRDPEAGFRVKRPTRVSLGLSWRFAQGEVEASSKCFAGISRYEVLSSEVPGVWTDVSPGETRAGAAVFAPTYDGRDAVTNVAIGGRYDLTKTTSPHPGFFTSRSPVGDESVFSAVDRYGVPTDVSLSWTRSSGAVGVACEWGDQGIGLSPSTNLPAVNGEPGISSFHVLRGLTHEL